MISVKSLHWNRLNLLKLSAQNLLIYIKGLFVNRKLRHHVSGVEHTSYVSCHVCSCSSSHSDIVTLNRPFWISMHVPFAMHTFFMQKQNIARPPTCHTGFTCKVVLSFIIMSSALVHVTSGERFYAVKTLIFIREFICKWKWSVLLRKYGEKLNQINQQIKVMQNEYSNLILTQTIHP